MTTKLDTATCSNMLQLYLDAEAKILQGQQHRFGDRMLTMANLAEVQAGIKDWNARLELATQTDAGRRRSVNVTPTY